MMQRLELTDNERAVLITALRRLVDFDPRALSRALSPQTHAVKGHSRTGWSRISHITYPILRAPAEPAATRVFVRGVRLVDVHFMARWKWAKVPATASRR
jgi:hypothetical protein